MKKYYQTALLAALGLGSITAARAASTDIFIGFNDANGGTPAQNDYVLDVGTLSALTTAAQNNGGTVDLMGAVAPIQISQSTFASTFNTAYSADSGALNEVTVGAVGALGSTLWQTAAVGITPAAITTGDFGNAVGQPADLVAGEYSSSETTGFTFLVAQSSTQAGVQGSQSVAAATGTNPMGLLQSGTVTVDLWQVSETTGLHKTVGNWTEQGYFTVDVNSSGTADDITYTVEPVPEPGTLALAGLGLAGLIVLRRRK